MKGKWKRLFGIIGVTLMLTACGGTDDEQAAPSGGEVHVAGAASLAPLLHDVKKQYEAEHSGVTLVMNMAGTQVLKAQIEQGAPADVMIAARQKDVDDLKAKGLVESSEHLASNEPILILSTEGARKIKTAEDLAQSGVRIVLGEQSSPIGEYSRKTLQKMGEPGFYEKVLNNVVSNESNEQNVLSKVVLGEADAGMVYQTSFQEEKAKGTAISAITIEKAQNVRSEYYLVRLKGISSAGGEFAKWMMGDKGKELLKKHGFLL